VALATYLPCEGAHGLDGDSHNQEPIAKLAIRGVSRELQANAGP